MASLSAIISENQLEMCSPIYEVLKSHLSDTWRYFQVSLTDRYGKRAITQEFFQFRLAEVPQKFSVEVEKIIDGSEPFENLVYYNRDILDLHHIQLFSDDIDNELSRHLTEQFGAKNNKSKPALQDSNRLAFSVSQSRTDKIIRIFFGRESTCTGVSSSVSAVPKVKVEKEKKITNGLQKSSYEIGQLPCFIIEIAALVSLENSLEYDDARLAAMLTQIIQLAKTRKWLTVVVLHENQNCMSTLLLKITTWTKDKKNIEVISFNTLEVYTGKKQLEQALNGESDNSLVDVLQRIDEKQKKEIAERIRTQIPTPSDIILSFENIRFIEPIKQLYKGTKLHFFDETRIKTL